MQLDAATVERLVEQITKEVLILLQDETNAPGDNGDSTCEDCVGQCVLQCHDKIQQVVDAGASRLTSTLGNVDMGPGLADNMGEGVATGSEWRTAPLWNIGLTAGVSGGEAYLHDGRAQTLEEAILWHGGEAEDSKEVFRNMSAADRAALIKCLQSL